jgi:carboxylesterase
MEIMKGWEPFSFNNGSDTGILLSQGFTGSTSSVIYLGQKLSEAGYNVEGPRLSGHGTRWEDIIGVSYRDWICDAEDSLLKLRRNSKKIFTAGLSMGGTLALRLAEIHPDIKGIVTVNHALLAASGIALFVPILKHLIKSVAAIKSDLKDNSEKENGYDRTPVYGIHELIKLQRETRRDIRKITVPILMFKSEIDHVLPAKNTLWAYNHLPSTDKEIVWLHNSYHVATMDFDKDLIAQKTIEFIRKHS